jgi:hypothetical protein
MHEKRNFLLVLVLAASLIWAVAAWVFMDLDTTSLFWGQRIVSVALGVLAAAWLVYALMLEDKLPNYLKDLVGEVYFESDGLAFMPTVRVNNGLPELSIFYQNRFENPVCGVVHLRPPEDSFQIKEGWHDVHFAFKASGGDFGVIHQPIVVPESLRGQVIDVKLAAASYYPRGKGSRWRKEAGIPCGSLLVDWGGAAFKSGVHEVSGEIELFNPCTVHLAMPFNIDGTKANVDLWRQEQIHAGAGK